MLAGQPACPWDMGLKHFPPPDFGLAERREQQPGAVGWRRISQQLAEEGLHLFRGGAARNCRHQKCELAVACGMRQGCCEASWEGLQLASEELNACWLVEE